MEILLYLGLEKRIFFFFKEWRFRDSFYDLQPARAKVMISKVLAFVCGSVLNIETIKHVGQDIDTRDTDR